MIVLDTNVISEVLARSPNRKVMSWLHIVEVSMLHLTAVTVAEIRFGIALLSEGARRTALAAAWSSLATAWGDRILALGAREAEVAGAVLSTRRVQGKPVGLADALIAAVCLTRDCPLATRNTRDFTGLGLRLVDPWQSDLS